jgi:hypothetical protein
LALLATLLTFGLAGQRQLVASALALWWSGLVVFVSFEHLRWVGFDGHHFASGVVAVISAWVLASGLPPLFEASCLVVVAVFGVHWLRVSSDTVGFCYQLWLHLLGQHALVFLACYIWRTPTSQWP